MSSDPAGRDVAVLAVGAPPGMFRALGDRLCVIAGGEVSDALLRRTAVVVAAQPAPRLVARAQAMGCAVVACDPLPGALTAARARLQHVVGLLLDRPERRLAAAPAAVPPEADPAVARPRADAGGAWWHPGAGAELEIVVRSPGWSAAAPRLSVIVTGAAEAVPATLTAVDRVRDRLAVEAVVVSPDGAITAGHVRRWVREHPGLAVLAVQAGDLVPEEAGSGEGLPSTRVAAIRTAAALARGEACVALTAGALPCGAGLAAQLARLATRPDAVAVRGVAAGREAYVAIDVARREAPWQAWPEDVRPVVETGVLVAV